MDQLGGNNINHKSDNVKKDRIKAKADIPVAGAIVTAAIMLSGLSLISSFQQQPVLAQQDQNMTGAGNATNATMTGAGNATNATMTGTNESTPVNSSPSAESLTGGTTTGGGATEGDGEASGGVPNNPGGAAGPQVSP